MIHGRTLAAILALALTCSARADQLRFLEGGSADLPSRRDGADLLLDTPMGTLRFPASDFAEIKTGPDPAREWPSRRDEARREGGADARMVAALWALDHGLVSEASAEVREVAAAHPDHPVASRMAVALKRLEAPSADPDLAAIVRSAPPGHRVRRGPHVLLVHQTSDAEAAERLGHLEAIVTAFYLRFASLGFDLAPPRTRLASIWFAKKGDYLDFLKADGADGFLTTRGYHVPSRGVVALYDSRDDPPHRRAVEAISARRDELRGAVLRLESAPPTARLRLQLAGEPPRTATRAEGLAIVAGLSRRVDRREMLLELSRREIDLGVAAHETVHQLVESSGLSPRPGAFPHWLSEGIAMQFESLRGGRWAGLGEPSAFRLRDLRRLPSTSSSGTFAPRRPSRSRVRPRRLRPVLVLHPVPPRRSPPPIREPSGRPPPPRPRRFVSGPSRLPRHFFARRANLDPRPGVRLARRDQGPRRDPPAASRPGETGLTPRRGTIRYSGRSHRRGVAQLG